VQPDHERAEPERHDRAGQRPGHEPERRAAAVDRAGVAGERPDEHHALGAEVDHAGALVDQEAQAGEREHRPGGDRRGDQRGERLH